MEYYRGPGRPTRVMRYAEPHPYEAGYYEERVYDDYGYEEEPEYLVRPRVRPRTTYYQERSPDTEELRLPFRLRRPDWISEDEDAPPVQVNKSMGQAILVGGAFLLLMLLILPGLNHFMALQTATGTTPAQQQQQVQQSGSTNDMSVVGQPSISEEKISSVLESYGSPLSAQTIYAYGQQYNIDPAFALAFFIHESGAGTTGAAVTHRNPGNLRSSPLEDSHDGFAYFGSWDTGIHAWYELISSNLYVAGGRTTVYAIVERYAPSADNNDPQGYAAAVVSAVNSWR